MTSFMDFMCSAFQGQRQTKNFPRFSPFSLVLVVLIFLSLVLKFLSFFWLSVLLLMSLFNIDIDTVYQLIHNFLIDMLS